MRDDIMRLADLISIHADDDIDASRLGRLAHHWSTQLRALARTDHVEDKLGVVPIKPGNWPEDSSHENGNYECKCCHCGATFYGHKRRVTCKVCASPAPDHSAGVGGMVATEQMIERAARKVCEISGVDWGALGDFTRGVLIDTQREAFAAALAQLADADADGAK